MKGWMIAIVLFVVLWWTNPEYDAHLGKLAEKGGVIGFVAASFADFHRINCGVFSVGVADGEMLTFGILGQVFWAEM